MLIFHLPYQRNEVCRILATSQTKKADGACLELFRTGDPRSAHDVRRPRKRSSEAAFSPIQRNDDRAVPPTLGFVVLPASEFLQPIPDQRVSPGRRIGCFYVDTGYRKTKKDRTAAQLSSPSWSGDANGSFPSVAWAVGTFEIWLPVTNHAGYTAVRAVIPAWRVD